MGVPSFSLASRGNKTWLAIGHSKERMIHLSWPIGLCISLAKPANQVAIGRRCFEFDQFERRDPTYLIATKWNRHSLFDAALEKM